MDVENRFSLIAVALNGPRKGDEVLEWAGNSLGEALEMFNRRIQAEYYADQQNGLRWACEFVLKEGENVLRHA